jgi:hypothetical protein
VASVPTGIAKFYASRLGEPALGWVMAACAETARTYAALAHPITLGHLSYRIAAGLGLPLSFASQAGTLLDALQPLVDLADNLADEAHDRARGIALESRYPGVPREVLYSLPPLMMACVVSALHEDFPPPRHRTHEASKRLLDVLSRMTEGQGQSLSHPDRVDNISSRQATLMCLPLWLHASVKLDDPRLARVERWAFTYGRLWQLHQDVTDVPEDRAPKDRFSAALDVAREVWPDFAPFTHGGALSVEALLPRGPR